MATNIKAFGFTETNVKTMLIGLVKLVLEKRK